MAGQRPEQYRYGHSELAGDRLRLLATLFEPSTRAYLEAVARRTEPIELALDLGCGPGYTTAVVAEVTGAARTIGVEFSPDFVQRARTEHDRPGLAFVEHDVTQTPFPMGRPDLIHARLLLAHLPDPTAAVQTWTRQLRPGGVVLLDEIVGIESARPTFVRYLELTVAMLAAHGTDMYIGSSLNSSSFADRDVVLDETVRIQPATTDVATMFGMNLATWRHDPWVVEHVDPTELDAIASDLDDLRSSDATDEITWTHRHLALGA